MWERSLTANNATSKSIAVRDRSYRKPQRMQGWSYFFWLGVLSVLEDFFLSLSLALDFFWLGVLGVSLRSLGESSVPRQLALPHQQGYSALSFLV